MTYRQSFSQPIKIVLHPRQFSKLSVLGNGTHSILRIPFHHFYIGMQKPESNIFYDFNFQILTNEKNIAYLFG